MIYWGLHKHSINTCLVFIINVIFVVLLLTALSIL